MRIPESLRAMGTDGFKISSQILMMSSLSSRLRLIFEWSVAAIHIWPSGAFRARSWCE
uniref:Uncharacterized protein n=1 Tax=Arundo donax TaxID=35708 RepID=A0A0A9FT96_ARUDO